MKQDKRKSNQHEQHIQIIVFQASQILHLFTEHLMSNRYITTPQTQTFAGTKQCDITKNEQLNAKRTKKNTFDQFLKYLNKTRKNIVI